MEGDDLAKHPGLYQRGGVWYVRKRVPLGLRHLEPREQVRISLETADRRQAIQRYPFKLAEIERRFDELRRQHRSRSRVEQALRAGKLEALPWSDLAELASDWWDRRSRSRTISKVDPVEVDDLITQIEDDLERTLAPVPQDGEGVEAIVDQLLVDAGVPARPLKHGRIRTQTLYPAIDRSSAQYRHLCDLVGRALKQEASLAKDYLLGRRTTLSDPLRAEADPPVPGSDRCLSHLIAEYRAERETLYGKESTRRKYGLLFRVMEEVLGADMPVRSIGRAQAVEVLAFLQSLPPNATKRFPALTLKEAAARAREQGLSGLAPNTVGSYMQNFAAVLRWAEDAGWGVKASTRGLVESRAPQVRRRGYTPDELHRLFEALERFRNTEPSKFWIPALALYTGARAGEIIQLRSEDVVLIGNVRCLDLSVYDKEGRRVQGKRLKTDASERLVPLHSHLLEAGFETFVEAQGQGSLFPDFEKGEDAYGGRFSKWFGRFKKSVGFDQPSLVFHSFRHGFRDACRDAEIDQETAEALGGWRGINQATRYGNRGRVPNLARALTKISFGEFKLGGTHQGSHRPPHNLRPPAEPR